MSVIKREYRIEHWRKDVQIATLETPTFEAPSLEECDKKAVARMNELSNDRAYQWDGLRVSRIDVPAVAEQTTFLKENGRQKFEDEY